jgi:hypothetical protein
MSHSVGVSPRSFVIAGLSAAVVGTAAITPVSPPAPAPATIAAAVELTSLASGLAAVIDNLTSVGAGIEGVFTNLGNGIEGAYTALTGGIENVITSLTATINNVTSLPDGVQAALKNSYDGVERWPAYVSDWTQFSLGLIPGLWWAAPGVAFAYRTTQPLARVGAYAFADLVGLDFAQLTRDISDGIKTSASNAAIYGKAWADSFVAVPPLPPYPGPWPDFRDAAILPAASTATLAAPQAAAVTSGVENAIKNTYNAVEPWVAWGFELAQWGMGFVPGLWWVAPGVSLAYFSIEPLVQAGVYTFADVLGLDFAQIGPDVQQGIQQSAQNFVNYGLAWIQSLIPFPPLPPFPPRPGAAVTAGPAATAVLAAAALPSTQADAPTDVTPGTAPVGDDAPASTAVAPVAESLNPPAEATSPIAESVSPDDTAAPAVETVVPVAETLTPADDAVAPVTEAIAAAETPVAAAEAPQPARGALRGHRAPAADQTAAATDGGNSARGDGNSAKAGRGSR